MILEKLPEDFDVNKYRLLNDDLKDLNDIELKAHYINNWKNEGRKYKLELPEDFDVDAYRFFNDDLKDLSNKELKVHYINNGINEYRKYKYDLPEDFDVDAYRLLNSDLNYLNDKELKFHYMNNGINENRKYKYDLPEDFDINNYRNLNSYFENLTDKELQTHFNLYCKEINYDFSFIIYTNKSYAVKIVDDIKYYLNKLNIKYKVIYQITNDDINSNLYKPNEYFILLFAHQLEIYPYKNKYIVYQLEQILQSNWANDKYINIMLNSLFIIDYSNENIRQLIKLNKNFENIIYYQPIPMPLNINDIILNNNEYDILLFGNYSIRRNNIIEYLNKKYKVKFVYNIFGEEIFEIIKKSKIILNIHFYKNAILETCRLNEILRYNKVIISELPSKDDYENKDLYNNYINYIDEINDDLSNINYLCDKIDYFLNNSNYNFFLKKNINNLKFIYDFTYNYFIKNLIKIDYLKLNNFDIILPKDFDCDKYRKLNIELNNLNDDELKNNYIKYGYFENKKYKIHDEFKICTEYSIKINYIECILWINLDYSKNRYIYMKELLKDLTIKNYKITAVDGKKNINLENKINIDFERKMSNYEIACTLSHIKSINYLKYIKGNYFMICEDDISFDNLIYFNHDLKKIIFDAPEFDILLLYKSSINNYDNTYIKWDESVYGTVCYIISKEGVSKLTEFAKYDDFTDNFIFDNNIKFDVADIFIYKKLNTYVYKYNFISTKCEDSTIHSDHLECHISNNNVNLNIILDDFKI